MMAKRDRTAFAEAASKTIDLADRSAAALAASLLAPGSVGRWQPADPSTISETARRVKSPLFCGGEQISQGAELGCLGHAGAIFVVRGLLRVLAKGAQRELGFAATRIDLENFR